MWEIWETTVHREDFAQCASKGKNETSEIYLGFIFYSIKNSKNYLDSVYRCSVDRYTLIALIVEDCLTVGYNTQNTQNLLRFFSIFV